VTGKVEVWQRGECLREDEADNAMQPLSTAMYGALSKPH
jgi:hypothetical protein